jgi:hypothetical protein
MSTKILVGKPEGKRPLSRPRFRGNNSIRMDLTEEGLEGVAWIYLFHDGNWWRAVANTVMKLRWAVSWLAE